MSDWADLAAEREDELRSDALAAQARRARLPDAQSAETCALCEEAIPAARREAVPGVQTCIDCARELEEAVRGYAARKEQHDPAS